MTNAKTILVVDDDSALRAGLQTVLRENGYRTLEAEDGHEAKELINKHKPDLVILDMMMPHWGGFAVLEHFKNNAAAPRFIMLTGHEGERHKAYAKQIGAVDYLNKPCSMDRLLERVGGILRPEKVVVDTTMRVNCRGCGARIKAPRNLTGKVRPCPSCKAAVVIREFPVDEGPRVVTW